MQPNFADYTLDSSGAIKVEEATSMEIWNILSFMHLWAKDLSWRQGTVLMGLPFLQQSVWLENLESLITFFLVEIKIKIR